MSKSQSSLFPNPKKYNYKKKRFRHPSFDNSKRNKRTHTHKKAGMMKYEVISG